MKLLNLKITTLLVAIFLASSAMAQNVMMSEEKALENFKAAAKLYRQGEIDPLKPSIDITAKENKVTATSEVVKETGTEITAISQAEFDQYEEKIGTEYEPIEDIDVSVNIENKTIENLVKIIIEQARGQSGRWTVKWRVSPENNYVLSERVNLTAETNLSNFMSYLVDRVNNMTGIQLFVTVFDKSRIILISDTYY